ncbi:cytochrome b/b6 domain-containing protein [Rhizobium sp. S163]|uniref:cytochrome b n=1 Tax=Rhizobium sp. S163 TaxID=3055039 RepID=UPI0025A9C10C|nr:cytochrome b/b6 domain-containing protein [Rhizobium sp. S163]MDM9645137.1 cytochrome b/b6 domain-containing protein [Rhizobium sp. S163]
MPLETHAATSSSPRSYSLAQRILHWLTALLVFFNLLLPDGMNAWNRSMRLNGSATADQIASANIHAWAGIAILVTVALRLVLRATQGVPAHSPDEPPLLTAAASIAHALLYLLLLAMPLSGMAAYYLGVNAAGSLHAEILKVILWALISLHVLGALAHQFYWKSDRLRRMTVG